MANHSGIIASRTPWTVWKGRKNDPERWAPQVRRCPLCYWGRAEKQLRTVVLKETLDSPLESKKIKPVHPKRNQPWILIGRTDAEAEAPSHLMRIVDSLGEDTNAGKDWRQKKGRQRMECLDSITDPMDTNLCKLQEIVRDREARHAAVYGAAKSPTRFSDWTTRIFYKHA